MNETTGEGYLMKIENSGISQITANRAESTQKTDKKAGSSAASAARKNDRADLSESARLLMKANAALEDSTGIDEKKVNLLSEMISSGNYVIRFEDLAGKLASQPYFRD